MHAYTLYWAAFQINAKLARSYIPVNTPFSIVWSAVPNIERGTTSQASACFTSTSATIGSLSPSACGWPKSAACQRILLLRLTSHDSFVLQSPGIMAAPVKRPGGARIAPTRTAPVAKVSIPEGNVRELHIANPLLNLAVGRLTDRNIKLESTSTPSVRAAGNTHDPSLLSP